MKQQKSMQDLRNTSYLFGGNDTYLEELYETYLKTPNKVDPAWRHYFNQLNAASPGTDISHADIRTYFEKISRQTKAPSIQSVDLHYQKLQEKVIDLILAYRSLGHLQANIDPLGLSQGVNNPILDLSYYGFTEADLDKTFDVDTFAGLKKSTATLREIHQALRQIYCGVIGIEYQHITELAEVKWIQERIEQQWPQFRPSSEEKQHVLECLIAADGVEKYLGFKYVGQRRFSLEGGDTLIPLLDTLIQRGAANGAKEIVIGMAHRGRLNVLFNILGIEPAKIFAIFEGKEVEEKQSGDVKYHLGYSSNLKTSYGPIHLTLAFNPSHLEIVSPVVQGSVRCRQRRRKDSKRDLVVPIQIHGDAAFAGQGVVMETFSMSQARWFGVGGSIHIVINNQVGFTISNPKDARSSLYCTDIAKMVEAPVLHVNANYPEAVVFAAQLALDYRTQFKKDIVIDLVCYRRHGHNEADEPSATQPHFYKIIKSLPAACTLYAKQLINEGVIDNQKEKQLADQYRKQLDEGKNGVEIILDPASYEFSSAWLPFLDQDWNTKTATGVSLAKIQSLAAQLEKLPEGFVLQAQVEKVMEARKKMGRGELALNWGYAEIMAYATLLDEGYPIRLCGQDSCRGTFSHRHAVLHDQNTDAIYIPLSHLSPQQVHINLVDSLLSEEAVLAFEYGFASAEPNNLVLWEAQYGDFANGAQVVIDQFISSGEQKWGRLCGLVMLLPHGYEGAGPEHSSARLERYLQLCAQFNMQVCVPTTPAQQFHLLRRQMKRPYRKPLIVMAPKSLLRHPLAVSSLDDLVDGEFQLVIPEIDVLAPKKTERVILCCGKVYYDLLEKRRELKLNTVSIIRIEQLYPFPEERLKEVLAPYHHVKKIIWCQEEPQNQGAWYSMQHLLQACLQKSQELNYAGRAVSAAPAGGYASVHAKEQKALIEQALLQ